jgi:putative PIN family toxin of toxin-antitoxin system
LRVVLDTIVHVSDTILSHGTPFEIVEAWRRQAYGLITSEAIISDGIIAEIERVLYYPRIRDRYTVSEQDVERLVESLRADALVIPCHYEVSGVSLDPDDDKFLACALEAQADCIVTGDPDLAIPIVDLGCYQGIDILKPREFWERLR